HRAEHVASVTGCSNLATRIEAAGASNDAQRSEFGRWLDTVKWLKKTQDYKDRKSIYSTNMTVDQINEVKNILADLRQKLEIRCEHSSRKHDAVEKMEVDRYLIIDVRQKAHYDGSKITFDKCINIPQSEIKPG
ncbi:hypothetical protein X777_02289, partial [Ooceraea biroi]